MLVWFVIYKYNFHPHDTCGQLGKYVLFKMFKTCCLIIINLPLSRKFCNQLSFSLAPWSEKLFTMQGSAF